MKNKTRNIIWTFTGIVLMIALVTAVTVISDTEITTTGTVDSENVTSENINNVFYVQVGNGSDIQAKIDLCPTNDCLVFIPPGSYTITQSINYTEQLQLIGSGIDSTVLSASGGFNGDNLIQSETPGTTTQHVKIAKMKIDCNSKLPNGIYFNTTKVSLIEEVYVRECTNNSIYLDQDNFYTKVEDVRTNNGNTGILINDNEVSVSNARISTTIGINISAGNNNYIDNARIDGSGDIGIWLGDTADTDLIGNRYEGYTTCLNISSSATDTRIIGGRFSVCGTSVDDHSNSTLWINDDELILDGNITMTSPDNTEYTCGVNNTGSWICS